MPVPVSIPRLGWNMEEGIFVEWLKADGDAVKPGDAVFRLEGEKATEDIESLDSGTLHIPANGPKPGDKLAVGAVIGYLLQPDEAAPDAIFSSPSPLAGEGGESSSRVRGSSVAGATFHPSPAPGEAPGLPSPA